MTSDARKLLDMRATQRAITPARFAGSPRRLASHHGFPRLFASCPTAYESVDKNYLQKTFPQELDIASERLTKISQQ
ncbi:hypothetical protein RRG08_004302 [Elysia crispata]|uniref:Uncharacterized protein n=1 Tax=Elysia crispata TaxID=231223 RepID=A0AAE1CW65_9GAST|nr:hypothetical protein RRG08_004302 [Elysia crispata]